LVAAVFLAIGLIPFFGVLVFQRDYKSRRKK